MEAAVASSWVYSGRIPLIDKVHVFRIEIERDDSHGRGGRTPKGFW